MHCITLEKKRDTVLFKSLGSVRFFYLKGMDIHHKCIKLIKIDSKDIYNDTNFFYFQINAVLLNFLFIKKNKSRILQKYEAAQLFST